MATQATSTAPIGIFQINHYYYVGQDAVNIQQAVNFAVADGNAGTVVIPQEYAGADTIAAVVNGSTSVYIMDERGGQRQAYLWVNTAYIAEPILPVGVGTPQINHQLFVGPLGKFPTIQSAITFAVANGGKYAIIIPQTYTGSEDIATLTGGATNVYLSDQRTYQWQNYYWTGTIYAPINVVQLGSLTVNGDIFATGNLDAANAAITGDITADGIQANDAEFETCIVDNSPVRTFANTADGPSQGMIWPEFGVPISEGDHWRDPSIDPATLAIWPPVGIPVSTGAAWGTSIDPATIPRLNTPNTFTAAPQGLMESGAYMKVRGNVAIGAIDFTHPGLTTSWNLSGGQAESSFTNVASLAGAGAFAWFNTWVGGPAIDTTKPLMFLDGKANLDIQSNAADSGTSSSLNTRNNGLVISWNLHTGFGETDFVNVNAGAGGGFSWYSAGSNTTLNQTTPPKMNLDGSGNLSVSGNLGVIGPIQTHGEFSYVQAGDTASQGGSSAGQAFTRFVAVVVGESGVNFPGQFNFETVSATTTSSVLDTLRITHVSLGPEGQSPSLWSISRAGNMSVIGAVTANSGSFWVSTSFAQNQMRIGARGEGGWNAGSPNINSDDLSLIVNPSPTGAIYTCWDQGSGGVVFGNGQGIGVASVASNGNITAHGFFTSNSTNTIGLLSLDGGGGTFNGACVANGFYTSGAKAFRITHPLDDEKQLTHCCIEGPEIAVFYRGEAMTTNSETEVTLPDYFEALTLPDQRTVQLTQIFEDDGEVVIGSNSPSMLSASRVKDGKFKIRSTNPIVKVYWEVKAVRADIAPLEVSTKKEKQIANPPIEPFPSGPGAPPADAGVDRDRTPEVRESKSKKVRA